MFVVAVIFLAYDKLPVVSSMLLCVAWNSCFVSVFVDFLILFSKHQRTTAEN